MPQQLITGVLVAFCFAAWLFDTESAIAQSSNDSAETEIVLRFSKELFEDLTRDVIEMSIPIDRRVEGMPLKGQATGKGFSSIELPDSDERAQVVMTITGTAVGRMRSDVGPANVFLTSRARFSTQKVIRFEGDLFRDDPATTDARNCTQLDRICAKRRGPIGHLVEHFGKRIANKAMPEMNASAEDMTREYLTQKYDESAVDLMAKLNESTDLDEIIDEYFPEAKTWKFHTATRSEYLVAGVGPPSAAIPRIFLDDETEMAALIEMWIRTTPTEATLLEMLVDLNLDYDLLRSFLPKEDADEVAEDVKLSQRPGWTIIQIGLPKPPGQVAGGQPKEGPQDNR